MTVLFSAFGLRCNVCTSISVSLENCDKNSKEMDCPVANRCGTVSMNFTLANVVTKSFARVCTTEALCNSDTTLKSCKAAGGVCKQECCATDLGCNSAQLASGTSASKPVSATRAAEGSAASSAFSVTIVQCHCTINTKGLILIQRCCVLFIDIMCAFH